jgi:hypothetical protein
LCARKGAVFSIITRQQAVVNASETIQNIFYIRNIM